MARAYKRSERVSTPMRRKAFEDILENALLSLKNISLSPEFVMDTPI
jgi:hypothetical protein